MFIKTITKPSLFFNFNSARYYPTTSKDSKPKVRTRIAPSPTGEPHIGTAYVGLMNYLFARKHGGDFILRIDDTDQKRCTKGSEQSIMKALEWLGIKWQEGPDKGGKFGPYRQSERTSIYKKYVDQLLNNNQAFKCYCHPKENKSSGHNKPEDKHGYDGKCLKLTEEEKQELTLRNTPFVVRLKVPLEGHCTVHDFIRGETIIPWSEVDMQVLMKSDGLPTYHLATVVDDHEMQITHVIRGSEWISSAPKHLLLFDYLGLQPPKITHLPLLLNEDKTKLSKRKNNVSILWYERKGFLPEAIINFLGLYAVKSTGELDEKISQKDLEQRFALENISTGGAVFNIDKLEWLNARWLREEHTSDEFVEIYKKWLFKENRLDNAIKLSKERIKKFNDIFDLITPFFSDIKRLEWSDYEKLKLNYTSDQKKELFRKGTFLVLQELTILPNWNKAYIEKVFRNTSEILNIKLKELIKPFYLTVLGSDQALPLFASMELLGRELCLERIAKSTAVLGIPTDPEKSQLSTQYLAIKSKRNQPFQEDTNEEFVFCKPNNFSK